METIDVKTIKFTEDTYVDATEATFVRVVFKCKSCGLLHRVQLGVPTDCGSCIDVEIYQHGVKFCDAGKAVWYERLFEWLGAKISRVNYR